MSVTYIMFSFYSFDKCELWKSRTDGIDGMSPLCLITRSTDDTKRCLNGGQMKIVFFDLNGFHYENEFNESPAPPPRRPASHIRCCRGENIDCICKNCVPVLEEAINLQSRGKQVFAPRSGIRRAVVVTDDDDDDLFWTPRAGVRQRQKCRQSAQNIRFVLFNVKFRSY